MLFLFFLGHWSCTNENIAENIPELLIELEFIDSVVVESFFDLKLAAVNEESGQMIFKDRAVKHFLLTSKEGEILDSLSIRGEAPNQVRLPMEFAFNDSVLIIKEFEGNMSLNIFNSELKKVKVSPPLAQGISFFELTQTHVSFSTFQSGEDKLIVGAEANGVEPGLMAKNWQKSEFYTIAEAGYVYDPKIDSLWRFNTYPENWEPRKDGNWKGYSFPYVTALGNYQIIGVLPRIGNQFFFYKWENNKMEIVGEYKLSHPDRNDHLDFDPNDDYFLYPTFYDLKGGGEFFLIRFSTEIPKAVRDEYRIRNPNYNNDPGFSEVYAKYWKDKYILVNHLGESHALKELPVAGDVHYFDKNDILYIKPKLEKELDYNVFYRYRVKS